jgi:hypothetical protein
MAGCSAVKKNNIRFIFNKSLKKEMTTEELTIEVEKALEEIRPFLNSDGGDITLISIEDDKHVKVRLEERVLVAV